MSSAAPQRKVAFYIRVSTERQAKVEEGSLKNQEQMLRAELERRNLQHKDWGAFVENYVDEGISAKTTNRPAFQRLMRDIELGRIDTVMFTELSRLSRSLKDFLNIFEFAQRHACDLVCLKTEIDTTSPYQGLVTKILIVFSEFEREMTSRRTAINAYERSKRGLANGGQVLLGYRRDKKHKGRLLIDDTEAAVVRAIFQTYARERSIRRTTDRIKARFEGKSPRLKRITSGKIYSALTNKGYIGIRQINTHSKDGREEVPAAWAPIVTPYLFQKAQDILKSNTVRYHRRGPERYLYLLSGLLACGKCGQRLQGRSAYSSNGKRHRYYSHRTKCPEGGLDRIDAELAQELVLAWLRDVASNGQRFRELEAQGRKRIAHHIGELRESLRGLEAEGAAIEERVEARIQELTRTRTEAVRESIEKSILDLRQRKKGVEEKQTFVLDVIRQTESILKSQEDQFTVYGRRIQKVLDQKGYGLKLGIHGLISRLLLIASEMKLALSGVGLKEPVRVVFAFAPPDQPKANRRDETPALVEGVIPLPPVIGLRSRGVLETLYRKEHLSAREIEQLLGVSHAGVLGALNRFAIPRNGNGRKRTGQLPFGFDYLNYQLVENATEQAAIRKMQRYRAGGLSLREIAGNLNQMLVPTKHNGVWQANTVRGILARA
jgi:site-specific DNA recombinase